jgi:hypothetical protein
LAILGSPIPTKPTKKIIKIVFLGGRIGLVKCGYKSQNP